MKLLIPILAVTTILSFITPIKAEEPALGGYCPVCYLAANKAAIGTADIAAKHNGKTYWFVSTDALEAFKANPDKYLPQYNGYCAFGMALGKKFESDPTVFKIQDGRIFLNKDAEIGKLFAKYTADHIIKADKHWKAMSKEMMEKEYDAKNEMMKK